LYRPTTIPTEFQSAFKDLSESEQINYVTKIFMILKERMSRLNANDPNLINNVGYIASELDSVITDAVSIVANVKQSKELLQESMFKVREENLNLRTQNEEYKLQLKELQFKYTNVLESMTQRENISILHNLNTSVQNSNYVTQTQGKSTNSRIYKNHSIEES